MQGAQGTMMLNMGLMMAQYEQQLLGEKLEAKYRDRRQSKSPMNRPRRCASTKGSATS